MADFWNSFSQNNDAEYDMNVTCREPPRCKQASEMWEIMHLCAIELVPRFRGAMCKAASTDASPHPLPTDRARFCLRHRVSHRWCDCQNDRHHHQMIPRRPGRRHWHLKVYMRVLFGHFSRSDPIYIWLVGGFGQDQPANTMNTDVQKRLDYVFGYYYLLHTQ